MLKVVQGNLIAHLHDHRAILHGVNCRGVAGRGIALALRRALPESFQPYFTATASGLRPGTCVVWRSPDERQPWIIHMATQDGYGSTGSHARPEWIDQALVAALASLSQAGIGDLALPRIGAGLGGLDWHGQVEPIIRARLEPWSGKATLYELAP